MKTTNWGEQEKELVADRSRDWLAQARRDLEQAEDSSRAGRHEWACFAAHQAAEKAAKALFLWLRQEPWGHVVARLLQELPVEAAAPAALVEKARFLDNLYVPTRDPNGHPEGAPFEHYGPLQSELALAYGREIIEFVRSKMA